MTIREAAEIIKDTVSADELVRLYGYAPDRAGYIPCPFHPEKTASCRIYQRPGKGFHCYGCHKGGSVIDWVIQHDGASFRQAVEAINSAMNLGLDLNEKPTGISSASRKAAENAATDRFADDLLDLIAGYDALLEVNAKIAFIRLQNAEAIPKEERTVHDYNEILSRKSECEEVEDSKEQLNKLRLEVMEWRRKIKTK